MRAQTETLDAAREAVQGRLRELGMTLAARGFKVTVDADRWRLTATNMAVAPDDPPDSVAIAYGLVKLGQGVYLAVDETGGLCCYWPWSGPTRGGQGEYERFGPAAAITDTTERTARVLRAESAGADE